MKLINKTTPLERLYTIELTESELHYIVSSVGRMYPKNYEEDRLNAYHNLKEINNESIDHLFVELLQISNIKMA